MRTSSAGIDATSSPVREPLATVLSTIPEQLAVVGEPFGIQMLGSHIDLDAEVDTVLYNAYNFEKSVLFWGPKIGLISRRDPVRAANWSFPRNREKCRRLPKSDDRNSFEVIRLLQSPF
jgi:hypothetical protein